MRNKSTSLFYWLIQKYQRLYKEMQLAVYENFGGSYSLEINSVVFLIYMNHKLLY